MKHVRIGLSFLLVTLCLFAGISSARANDHAVVIDDRGNPVRTQSTGTCVRTKWIVNDDICKAQITEINYQNTAKRTISQDERTVYFPFNVAQLTPQARERLDTLAEDIRSRNDVKGAHVAGFADRIGTPSYNEALSKKRAANVRNYLIAKGIVNAEVAETKWFGATMPATNCAGSLSRPALIDCLQKDRRVEVEIDYTPETVASR